MPSTSKPPYAATFDAGHREIDNNRTERSLRGLAIASNNWLFTGGHAAARLFSFIASAHRPGDPLFSVIERGPVGVDQQRVERRRLVALPGGQFKAQRVASAVIQQVDFAAQAAAAAAQRVVGRFVTIPIFPPPAADLAARTEVPSTPTVPRRSSPGPAADRSSTATSVPSAFHRSKWSHTVHR